jgi:hypothetical protein
MYVKRKVNDCDFTGEKYATAQDGFAVVCRGATGRWCEVMWGGPTAMAEQNISEADLLSYEQAYAKIEELGDGNYADF